MRISNKVKKDLNLGKLIGRGVFTTVYEHIKNPKKVVMYSNCTIKEILTDRLFKNTSHYFPKYKTVEGYNYTVLETYKLNRIDKLKNLPTKDINLINGLDTLRGKTGEVLLSGLDALYKKLKDNRINIIKKYLTSLIYDFCLLEVKLDIKKDNFMLNDKGKLMFNDIFFLQPKAITCKILGINRY